MQRAKGEPEAHRKEQGPGEVWKGRDTGCVVWAGVSSSLDLQDMQGSSPGPARIIPAWAPCVPHNLDWGQGTWSWEWATGGSPAFTTPPFPFLLSAPLLLHLLQEAPTSPVLIPQLCIQNLRTFFFPSPPG